MASLKTISVEHRKQIFQVDAFSNHLFAGNPAAVIPLDHFLDDSLMQAIAAENNLSETAFLVREGKDYRLRWFTPAVEVPLCGHATLASAAVVMERLEPERSEVTFHSASGPLIVRRSQLGYIMNFPARQFTVIPVDNKLTEVLGVNPCEVAVDSSNNYIVLLESAELVRKLTPDIAAIARMERTGIIVTAPGEGPYDFVSRYFAPAKGIPEDPVTGGAHCALVPYWAKRLGKTEFHAFQASKRGGEIICRLHDDRVELEGNCVFYLDGIINIQK